MVAVLRQRLQALRRLRTRDRAATDDRLRVLFVNTAKNPPIGAGPWLHAQTLRNLDKLRFELHVACATGTTAVPAPMLGLVDNIPGVTVHQTDFGADHLRETFSGSRRRKLSAGLAVFPIAASFIRLAYFARRHHIDIVYTDERARDALASTLIASLSGAKCVIHMHVAYGGWMSSSVAWSLRRADGIIAISHFVERSLLDDGRPPERLHLVPNAIGVEQWQPGVGRDAIRREFGIAGDAPVFTTVCRLIAGKGADDLIRALGLIVHDLPDARLIIVGAEQTPGYRASLEALATEVGVSDRVILTGRRADVSAILAASDAFAMPSIGEPFGLAYLEAMAMCLPVVGYVSGATAEVIDDGVTGLLSRVGDVAGLAEHLSLLLSNPEQRSTMGLRGREIVETRFTAPLMAAATAAVFRAVAGRD